MARRRKRFLVGGSLAKIAQLIFVGAIVWYLKTDMPEARQYAALAGLIYILCALLAL